MRRLSPQVDSLAELALDRPFVQSCLLSKHAFDGRRSRCVAVDRWMKTSRQNPLVNTYRGQGSFALGPLLPAPCSFPKDPDRAVLHDRFLPTRYRIPRPPASHLSCHGVPVSLLSSVFIFVTDAELDGHQKYDGRFFILIRSSRCT